MTRRGFVRPVRGESGASLIIALAMVTVISVALVAALGFGTSSLKTVASISTQRLTAYSADSAIDTAIQTLRINSTSGTTAAGTACPTVAYPATGLQPAASVACTVVAARGKGVPGVSMPPYAIWALGTSASEPGLYSSPSLTVDGPIASNSPANGTNGYDSVQVGTLDLVGLHDRRARHVLGHDHGERPGRQTLPTGVSLADPRTRRRPRPALTAPNPTPTCAVADAVLQFSPGYYTNTTMLETPAYGACRVGYLYFKPGVYYFDFGFDPAYTGRIWDVRPAKPSSVASSRTGHLRRPVRCPAPGGGVSVGCKNETDGATTGVQFIFGGESQMTVATAGAKVELCADPTPVGTSQQIAIYGQKTGAVTPLSATRVPTERRRPPRRDGPGCRRTGSRSTTWFRRISYRPRRPGESCCPAMSARVRCFRARSTSSYALKVAHQETTSSATNISSLAATIGTTCPLVPTKHNTTTLTAPVTDTFPLTTTACIAAVQSTFSVTFKATAVSGQTFTENLDGISLVVTYTPAALHAESGCITVVGIGGAGARSSRPGRTAPRPSSGGPCTRRSAPCWATARAAASSNCDGASSPARWA